jgi:hypothetical protein
MAKIELLAYLVDASQVFVSSEQKTKGLSVRFQEEIYRINVYIYVM